MVMTPWGWWRASRPISQDRPREVMRFSDGPLRGARTMTCEEAEDIKVKLEQIMLDSELNQEERDTLGMCERVLSRGGS